MKDNLLMLQQEAAVSRMTPDEWPLIHLYRSCLRAIEQEQALNVYVSWIMAIAFLQSQGGGFFDKDSSLFRGRANRLPFATSGERREWLSFIEVKDGVNKGKVPKFEYDSSVEFELKRSASYVTLERFLQVIVSCRWGVSQMPGSILLTGGKNEEIAANFARFSSSEELQFRVLVRWVKKAQLDFCSEPERIFERFFYEGGTVVREHRSVIASALNAGFSEFIACRNLKQCLYQNPFCE